MVVENKRVLPVLVPSPRIILDHAGNFTNSFRIGRKCAYCDQIVDGNILVIVSLDLGRTKRYLYHYKRQYLEKFRIVDTKPENYRSSSK